MQAESDKQTDRQIDTAMQERVTDRQMDGVAHTSVMSERLFDFPECVCRSVLIREIT